MGQSKYQMNWQRMLNSLKGSVNVIATVFLLVVTGCNSGNSPNPSQASIDLLSFVGSDSNTNQVSSLLAKGADPNLRFGWPASTPLHISVATDSKAIAKLLVEAGATNGIKDSSGRTAIDLLEGRHPTDDEIKEWRQILKLHP